jgi:hypothetical protein
MWVNRLRPSGVQYLSAAPIRPCQVARGGRMKGWPPSGHYRYGSLPDTRAGQGPGRLGRRYPHLPSMPLCRRIPSSRSSTRGVPRGMLPIHTSPPLGGRSTASGKHIGHRAMPAADGPMGEDVRDFLWRGKSTSYVVRGRSRRQDTKTFREVVSSTLFVRFPVERMTFPHRD